MSDRLAYRHADVARRTDPDQVVVFGAQPHEVAGLRVTLCLEPGLYAIETTLWLPVERAPEQEILHAAFIVCEGRRRLSYWGPLPPSSQEPTRSRGFSGIHSTGLPVAIDVGVLVRTSGGEARYDVGHLLARAIPTTLEFMAVPGLGPLVTVARPYAGLERTA